MRSVRPWMLVAAVLPVIAAGCAPARSSDDTRLTVLAAASLTETFTAIGEEFEADNPGTTVTFSFEGSATLASQINQGAPADVFASAAPRNMDTVTEAGNISGDPEVFIRNRLVIAVSEDNPASIDALDDLADPDVKVAMCAPKVPCGAAAAKAAEAGEVDIEAVTEEKDVKGALSKLELGEVDAALVYRSDVRAAKGVEGIEFDEAAEAINDYPIAVCAAAEQPSLAADFIEFVGAAPAQRRLTDAGFQAV